MKLGLIVCVLVIGSAGAGCGGDSAADPDGGSTADAGGTGEWTTLISGDWTLQPGTEDYVCVRTTVTEDLYISEFRAMIPNGTHHTVLAIDTQGGADGTFPCEAGTQGSAAIFGSGIGTNPIAFPAGVAVKLTAGQQLLINLHLYNVGDAEITGTSGAEIKTIAASEVEHEAEIVLMGSVANLSVPAGQSTQIGRCTMNGDVTLFAVNPHMHQLGTHMKVIAKSSVAGDVTIHDAPYDFEDQRIYPLTPLVEMKQGDEVEVQCGYDNTTGQTVGFGDSSNDEMCFGTMYRYPRRGAQLGIICDADIPFGG
jgi:hypothetical protein